MSDQDSLTVLDLTPLLEAFGELDEHLISTLHLFVSSTRPLLEGIGQCLASGDVAAAREAAHSAKGASNMTGAVRLGALCARIDDALKARDLTAAQALLVHWPAALAEVEAEIAKL